MKEEENARKRRKMGVEDDDVQEQFEREKEQALEQLRQDHQREIRALEQRFCQSQLLDLEHK